MAEGNFEASSTETFAAFQAIHEIEIRTCENSSRSYLPHYNTYYAKNQ